MDMETLTRFLMWCSIINGGLLVFSFLMIACAGDLVYRMHTRFLPMSRETFNVVIYSIIGGCKILWGIFNLVPFIALKIIA